MASEERSKVCRYCGLVAPQGHWRPYTYIEKHELHCAKNPKLKVSWNHLNKKKVNHSNVSQEIILNFISCETSVKPLLR